MIVVNCTTTRSDTDAALIITARCDCGWYDKYPESNAVIQITNHLQREHDGGKIIYLKSRVTVPPKIEDQRQESYD